MLEADHAVDAAHSMLLNAMRYDMSRQSVMPNLDVKPRETGRFSALNKSGRNGQQSPYLRIFLSICIKR
jgi:hypothetical protein